MKKKTEMTSRELLELLYHQEPALRMYLRFCGVEDQDMDEVLQDVLIAAWRKIGTLRDPDCLEPWIRTIARRRAIRHQQRMRRYWERNYPLSCYEEERETAGRPLAESLVHVEPVPFTDSELYDLVMAQGSPASNILMLHYVYGEPYVEIARMLHMPAGTVRSIAGRTREKLRKLMEERGML